MLLRTLNWLLGLSSAELLFGFIIVTVFFATAFAMIIVCWQGYEDVPDWPKQD